MLGKFIWFIFFFFLGSLHAQDDALVEPEPTPTPPPQANVQFSIFVWPHQGILGQDSRIPGIPRMFYTSPQGQPRPVRAVRNAATPLMPYIGELPLVLYNIDETWTPPPVDAPVETKPTVVQEKKPIIITDFPIEWKRVMIIVFPQRRNKDGTILSMPLPYQLDQLQPGMARIYNGSNKPLVLKFRDAEDKLIKLEPFKVIDFSPSNLTDSAFSRVFIYGKNKKGQLGVLHTSNLFFEEEKTNYFFLYPEGDRRIRIMRIGGHPGDEASGLPLPQSTPSPADSPFSR